MFHAIGRVIEPLARWCALLGGIVLIGVVIMSCLSIIGRALDGIGLGPIQGDYELVQMGIGFAIFAFLPWCQLRRGHATVDLFQARMGRRMNRTIDLISDIAMFTAATLIMWRLWLGMLDKKSYGETTFILQFPVWIPYAAGLIGAVVFVIVAAYCVWRSGRILAGGGHD
jgi:TRAP-type C4-dicarboxylate transport system permease small subunit